MNLKVIPELNRRFNVPVGLSDHTLGTTVPVVAVSLGACIVEKHFTLSRAIPGPDSAFSLEPREFRTMVDAIRETEQALGNVRFELGPAEAKSRVFRRSLFVVEDMRAGDEFTEKTIRSIRPSNGLHTRYLTAVLGRRATCDLKRGTPLQADNITPGLSSKSADSGA
jgi:sialic acid synthase SpsE